MQDESSNSKGEALVLSCACFPAVILFIYFTMPHSVLLSSSTYSRSTETSSMISWLTGQSSNCQVIFYLCNL